MPRTLRQHRMSYLCLCAALQACSSTSPSDIADGVYALVRYGMSSLPANLEQLPNPGGTPSSCWLTLAEGALNLNATANKFQYNLTYRNSCDGSVLGTGEASGDFEQNGNSLTFQAVGGNPPFPGEVSGSRVVVQRGTPFLHFARTQ